jgi:short subunit dehydrogenase-like uncharacterized protein
MRVIDFGRGPVKAICVPWGDVSTAWYSTKIPNIEVYMAAPLALRVGMRAMRVLGPLLASGPAQRALKRRIRAGAPGPSAEQRARGRSYLWGEVQDDAGGHAEARIETPESYAFTATAALEIVHRVLSGKAPAGFQTPSMAYGPDLVLAIEGCTRSDASP